MDDIVISEKKLEDIIFDHLTQKNRCERHEDQIESTDCEVVERQLDLGPYGIADIITFSEPDFDLYCNIRIFELKKGEINKDTLVQVLRYKAGIMKYLEEYDSGLKANFELYLVGGSVSGQDDFQMIVPAVNNLEIYTYDLNADGVFLKSQNEWFYKDLRNPKKLKKIITCIDMQAYDSSFGYASYLKTQEAK